MRRKWQIPTKGHFPPPLSPIHSALPWGGLAVAVFQFTRMPKCKFSRPYDSRDSFLQVIRQRFLSLRAGEREEKHAGTSLTKTA